MSGVGDFECGETHWGQWDWADTGPGKWHAVLRIGIGLTIDGGPPAVMPMVELACGRIRQPPNRVEHAAGEPVCAECIAKVLDLGGLKTDEPVPEYVVEQEPVLVETY